MKTRVMVAAVGTMAVLLSGSVQASRYAFGEYDPIVLRHVEIHVARVAEALDVLAVERDDPQARAMLAAAIEDLAKMVSEHGVRALGPEQVASLEAVIQRAAGLGALNALPGGSVIAGALTGAVGDHGRARAAAR